MRTIVLLTGLAALLLAAPALAGAERRGGDGDRLRQGAAIEVRSGHGRRTARHQRHRAGPPKAWYYKPGRPAQIVPWPPAPRHGFAHRPRHDHRPKVVALVPLPTVLGRLRHQYPRITHAGQHGHRYVVSARDPFGRRVQVVVDARTGHVLERSFLRW